MVAVVGAQGNLPSPHAWPEGEAARAAAGAVKGPEVVAGALRRARAGAGDAVIQLLPDARNYFSY